MSQKYQKLTIIPEDVNILLVGENNAGKSTFAHAFANYIKYGQFSMAEENKVSYLPPFSLNGTSYKGYSANVNKNSHGQQKDNKNVDLFPTKIICSYSFPLLKYGRRIHLIDTPGFGDVFNDINNFESILTYISQIENLHAVCFVLKPSSLTETLRLQYHIKFLLSKLEKTASKNIMFLFTHSRDEYYSPEYANSVLKNILDQIKSSPSQADIKRRKENVFCLDNEAFHFLVSAKDAASHSNTIRKTYSEIWEHSVAECWRMIAYILGKSDGFEEITPHKVKNTVLLYNARKIISQTSQFFVDIADIIEHLDCGFVLTDNILSGHSGQGFVNMYSKQAQELIAKIEQEKLIYVNDKQAIESVLRNLALFVRLTAMLSSNDSHEPYIKYLINQKVWQAAEKDTDAQTVINYHGLLKQYAEEIRIINKNVLSTSPIFTATNLLEGMEKLKTLEMVKQKFQVLHREVITTRTK